MKVIKSVSWDESFTEQELSKFSKTIVELEKKMVCDMCAIRKKSNGLCPEELETVCEYSSY